MKLTKNQKKDILETIIQEKDISSQSELVEELAKHKITLNQSTLSRYLAEMKIIKAAKGLKSSIYQTPPDVKPALQELQEKLSRDVLAISYSSNKIMIITVLGEAGAVGKTIDAAAIRSVLGTITGYDAALILVDKRRNTKKVVAFLEKARRKEL
jgi:transcriptional regulator of arginine metabolism